MTTAVIHIAGNDVRVGDRFRQRCAWCGALIVEVDAGRIEATLRSIGVDTITMATIARQAKASMWRVGSRIASFNGQSWVSDEWEQVGDLPDGSCGLLDPSVTA